jgi:hypothetical protein
MSYTMNYATEIQRLDEVVDEGDIKVIVEA